MNTDDFEGTVVSEEEVATDLGFESVENFRTWVNEGSPTGRCSNDHCYRPAFWPDLDKPCKYCGSPVNKDKKNDPFFG